MEGRRESQGRAVEKKRNLFKSEKRKLLKSMRKEVKERKAPIYIYMPKIPQPPTIRVDMRKPRVHT